MMCADRLQTDAEWAISNLEDVRATILNVGDVMQGPPGFLHAVLSVGALSAVSGYAMADFDTLDDMRAITKWDRETALRLGPRQQAESQDMLATVQRTWKAMGKQLGKTKRQAIDAALEGLE